MSVQALSWVFDFSKSQHSSRLVLLSIANHAKADGTGAWPSYERLSTEALIDRSTVRLCLQELEDLGELQVESGAGPHGCNLYSLPKMKVGETFAQADLTASVGESDGKTRLNIRPEPSLAVKEPSLETATPENLEPQKQPPAECSACGAVGVHHCPGPSAARAKRAAKQARADERAIRKGERQREAMEASRPRYVDRPQPPWQSRGSPAPVDDKLDDDYPKLRSGP